MCWGLVGYASGKSGVAVDAANPSRLSRVRRLPRRGLLARTPRSRRCGAYPVRLRAIAPVGRGSRRGRTVRVRRAIGRRSRRRGRVNPNNFAGFRPTWVDG